MWRQDFLKIWALQWVYYALFVTRLTTVCISSVIFKHVNDFKLRVVSICHTTKWTFYFRIIELKIGTNLYYAIPNEMSKVLANPACAKKFVKST